MNRGTERMGSGLTFNICGFQMLNVWPDPAVETKYKTILNHFLQSFPNPTQSNRRNP